MTSEIAILNTTCVALAADSAVTVSSLLNEKVYNSANKIFSLSPTHAIGIMIYGNAEFMGIPWEVLINEFKSYSRNKKYYSLVECQEEFLSFIEIIKGEFISEEKVLISITEEILDDFMNYYEKSENEEEEIINFNSKLSNYLKKEIIQIMDNKNLDKSKLNEYKNHFLKDCFDILDDYFKTSISYKIYKRNLAKICDLMFLKVLTGSLLNGKTGIVVTGYGENEIFPTLIELEIYNYCFGKLHFTKVNNIKIKPSETSACIIPFAQKEMIYNFMQGVDPKLHLLYLDIVGNVFDGYVKFLEEAGKISVNSGTDFKEEIEEIVRIVNDVAFQKQQEEFVNPIINTIKFLPKDALAEMAETLINLTSFKRKVTLELESVGGPIDVAIISKNEGFIWIKRKHYFNEKLNPKYALFKE